MELRRGDYPSSGALIIIAPLRKEAPPPAITGGGRKDPGALSAGRLGRRGGASGRRYAKAPCGFCATRPPEERGRGDGAIRVATLSRAP